MSQQFQEFVGAVHLHSNYSDGSLSIPEIAAIAQEKDLDYLMFSDHNTLAPKRAGLEGWYGRVLVLIGCELNDPEDRNHYLAFRIQKEIPTGQWAEAYTKQVKDQGGFGIVAHPAERRNFSEAYPPYPWTAWNVEFDGIEIWNQLSEWAEGITKRNFAWRILHPLRSIRYPVWETLNRWDQLNLNRRVVGVGGIDVHGRKIQIWKYFSIQVYPYKVQFKSIRTHFLLESSIDASTGFDRAESEIFKALEQGHCFISNYSLGNARGFRFWMENGHHYPMGSRMKAGGLNRFHIQVPCDARIRFLRDGKVIKETYSNACQIQTSESGVYRVEVFRRHRGWIYSNPIVVEEG